METLKQMIFTNWPFMRWFRLVISLIILFQAYHAREYMIGAIGLFFLIQAITGYGCCNSNSCATPMSFNRKEHTETKFQEIKSKAKE